MELTPNEGASTGCAAAESWGGGGVTMQRLLAVILNLEEREES